MDKAKQVKKLIEENIGRYSDILWAGQNRDKALESRIQIAQRIAANAIALQWVPGNASQAEDSFFRINEAASPLDATEKRLLKARNKPMAIAARAIIRSGGGHKYWGKFSIDRQERIVEIAVELHDWLFKPQLDSPVKTIDIPLAGKSYSEATQELILNVVNFSNGIKIIDASRIRKGQEFPENVVPDEIAGEATIEHLIKTRKALANITGTLPSSLGLHPLIYFYSHQGRYQITAFMAVLHLIKDYEAREQLRNFTFVRKSFEEFLWKHKILVNQATTTWGSGAKGYVNLSKLFDFIIQQIRTSATEQAIIQALDGHNDYNFFKPGVRALNPSKRKNFSSEGKSEVFIKEGVTSIIRCSICGGFLHKNSIHIDHDLEIENGGIGNADNGRLAHPYCNSIKKSLKKDGFIKATGSFVSL